MKPDEFEQHLSRQPMRQIPGEWRAEILREGRRAAVPEIGDADTASLPILNWRTVGSRKRIFWPHPEGLGRAGGGLDFDFCRGFFDARHNAGHGGKGRAAVAGSHRGIAAAAADAGGIDRREPGARGRGAEIFAAAAQRARGNFDDVNWEGRRAAVPFDPIWDADTASLPTKNL